MALSDEAIVELYWKRDEQAIRETQSKYERYLNKISYNILADEEDCKENINDTYWKAWNSMPEHKPAVLSTYLGRINRQGAIDIYRKKHSGKRCAEEFDLCLEELEECVTAETDVEREIDARLLKEVIDNYLCSLPEKKRIVFLGRYFFMDSMKEIAGYTKTSEQNVKNILHRTRMELKSILRKEGYVL